MSKKYTNELIHESSLYLLQHAHNPVNWYSWNENSLSLAKKLDRPILLSIGYSSCHWCHVMERESFENEETAEFMNKNFINIKVDREERQDLDGIYMDAVQILTGSGGWPLNVFLTPDAKPFYGGTYFPPTSIYNRPSWIQVLRKITDIWENERSVAEEQAENLLRHMRSNNEAFSNVFVKEEDNKSDIFSHADFEAINTQMLKQADMDNGGFGNAPKFPQTLSIQFLLAYGKLFDNQDSLNHARLSLKSLINGGIYDHLGGGICRYSTDEKWLAPHFEKMLYDNALFVIALSEAYQIFKDEEIKKCIEQTISFCVRELGNGEGAYYDAIDADSEGEEGKFYLWDKSELDAVLKEDSETFCSFFNVTSAGNWEGKNILNRLHQEQYHDIDFKRLSMMKEKLFMHRNNRIKPVIDDKILIGWNALFLTALCKASAALKNDEFIKLAEQLFDFIESRFFNSDGTLLHTYNKSIAKQSGYLDDYAYFIQSCIYLQELTGNQKYLNHAKRLTEFVIQNFGSSDSDLFYYSQKIQKDLVFRKIEFYDAAIPSANSVMAFNLNYLSEIFQLSKWKELSYKMLVKLKPLLIKFPNSFGFWCCDVLFQFASRNWLYVALTRFTDMKNIKICYNSFKDKLYARNFECRCRRKLRSILFISR